MSTSAHRRLARPTLHLVIAEDHEWWSEKLQSLGDYLRQWSFARTGQLALSVHACRSVEAFEGLVGSLLSEGALVYATLDLKMPWAEGEQTPDVEAGERMIDLCLQWKRQGRCLEFCLASEIDDSLDRLFRESSELKKLGIRKIYKSQILGTNGLRILSDVVVDIQSFVRRHLLFCTIELPGSGERVPVWFGGKEPLLDLLNRADHIASGDAGVYILLAEAGGYEIDWVKLCCELRGVDLSDLDISKVDPDWHPEWKSHFQDPPPALLVRNLDQAHDRCCDIAPVIEKERFFEKVAARNTLVFFQFPLLATNLDVSKLDEAIEVPVLEACFKNIYQDHSSRTRQQGLDFGFENHRRIVTFPSYEVLKASGVVERTIDFQTAESQRQMGNEGVEIDHEILAILNEIPWDQKGGLHQLRRSIQSAYSGVAAGKKKDRGSLLGEEHFTNSVVVAESKGELGFLVRGRRLYRLLESRDTSLGRSEPQEGGSESERALLSLETLWQLYDGLERLRQLRDRLGHQPSNKAFTPQDYDTLHEARNFLDNLFDNPGNLRRQIDEFRSHLKRRARAWKAYYPALDDSRMAAVENIEFTWPFSRLPLHPSVFAYLQENGVSPLIHKEIQNSLHRFYPDLEAQWEEAKTKRIDLRREMTRREEERKRAERYVREGHSQPVLVHLVPRSEPAEQRSSFLTIFSSFLIFNSYVALAENHYAFGSTLYTDQKRMKALVEKVELGHMVGFLCGYIGELQSDARGAQSIFSHWRDQWPNLGGQRDAVRLAGQMADDMLSQKEWKIHELDLLKTIASAGRGEGECSIGSMLNFFLNLRNGFKAVPEKLDDYASSLRDLMRRFVAATTGAFRLGRVTDGKVIDLWRKEAGEQSEPATLAGNADRWTGRLVVARECPPMEGGATFEALFPIDDLIRLRPVHDSIWAYNKDIWLNLTHTGSGEEARLSEADQDWLPDPKERTTSELWKSLYHG